MKFAKYLTLFAVLTFFFTIFVTGCGEKKTDVTTQKKDTAAVKTQTTNSTQKMDTTKPKTDTTKTTDTDPNTVIMETSMGNMTIELYPDDAPKHVANFK